MIKLAHAKQLIAAVVIASIGAATMTYGMDHALGPGKAEWLIYFWNSLLVIGGCAVFATGVCVAASLSNSH